MSLFDLIWVFDLFGISYSRAFGILLGRGYRAASRLGQGDQLLQRPYRTGSVKRTRNRAGGSQHVESQFRGLPDEMVVLRRELLDASPLTGYDDWLRALEAYWRTVCLTIEGPILAQMKALVPTRSGRLANSFSVDCAPTAGADFTLLSTAPYAHAVQFKRPVLGTYTVYGLFRQLLITNWSLVQSVATLSAYRAVGI